MWSDLLESNFFVKDLFKSIPDLTDVRISKLESSDDGDRLNLDCELNLLPDNPPKKWDIAKSKYSSVIFELNFFEISNLQIKIDRNLRLASIEISKNKDGFLDITLTGKYSGMFQAESGIIQKIRPCFGFSGDLEV